MIGPFFVGDIPATALSITVTRNGFAMDLTPFTSVEIAVTGPTGGAVPWVATPIIGAGIVTVPFPATSPFATAGVYLMTLTMVGGTARERTDTFGIQVLSTTPAWCSLVDVELITGRTVANASLSKALFDIEIACGRLFQYLTDEVLCDDDEDWLKRAIAHQAVFIDERPDKDVANDLTAMSTLGGGSSPTPDGLVVAPMARRALNQLSWVGARTIRIGQVSGASPLDSTLGDIEGAPWERI